MRSLGSLAQGLPLVVFSGCQASMKSDFSWFKNNSGRQLLEQRELGFC